MPLLSGYEVFNMLREVRSDIPVLIISGNAPGELIRKIMEQPATGFLPKPFSLDRLQAALHKLLVPPQNQK